MPIHLITEIATSQQLSEMLVELDIYIKLAVDVNLRILAGGGELHVDCETKLLEIGSKQKDIWGADWFPDSQETTFESLINIRPHLGNYGIEIEKEVLRKQIREIVENLLGGVSID